MCVKLYSKKYDNNSLACCDITIKSFELQINQNETNETLLTNNDSFIYYKLPENLINMKFSLKVLHY